LRQFSENYFSRSYTNEWGDAINFDGPDARGSREYFLTNAAYWIREFHFDGLRIDATQQMFDASDRHIVAEIGARVRDAAGGRRTCVIAENEPEDARVVRAEADGGWGLDAVWNEDYHRSAVAAVTGRTEAYFSDHPGTPQELISAVKYGFIYQGQRYSWQDKGRGTPTRGLGPSRFVTFLQNHDQIANTGQGRRCHQLTSPGRYRAVSALLLLGPNPPMLFQGQEFAASAPFLYFADNPPDRREAVRAGRAKFVSQFPSLAAPESQERLPDPADAETFHRCKLDLTERVRHADIYGLHRDLLRLRREDPVLCNPRPGEFDGAVLGQESFLLRFFGEAGDDRLLIVNFGRSLVLRPAPEPLLAPPIGGSWRLLWSSEDPRYGGGGTPAFDRDVAWTIPGHAALLFAPAPGGNR
jgi:maltooligosyltrehalose trehalohydrolase